MIEPQKIQWKRLSAEAVAIVASILFAFAIDAWWDDRQKAGDEQILLRSLLEDLTEKKVLLADDRTYNEAILGAVVGLLRAANDPTSELEEDAIDRLIADTWWYNAESKWDSAPMTSLVGGEFSAVSNPILLQKLGELQLQMARVRNFYRSDENFHHNTYTPFLITKAFMPQIISKTEHYPGRPELSYHSPEVSYVLGEVHTPNQGVHET